MKSTTTDPDVLTKATEQALFTALDAADRTFIEALALQSRFTHQELRILTVAARDLRMWEASPLSTWWPAGVERLDITRPDGRKQMMRRLHDHIVGLQKEPNTYPQSGLEPRTPPKLSFDVKDSERTVAGRCPVASEDTVCCNLRTIDAVENCGFGCSYCTIQTFYGEKVTFDSKLGEKLAAIELEPDRRYHYCTGQSSDSLMWGNRNGVLDDLCGFARDNPNVLLEFKTKSRKVEYFLEHDVPPNIVCSWSLNTPAIIANEEHFTADLDERIAAARRVADRGVRVSFHFHPMVWHEDWDAGYPELARRVQDCFEPEEVLFVSLGSVTFIKPVMQEIRKRGGSSKMLQMELARDPKGKFTYPAEVKEQMFSTMYDAFKPWHDSVFFYLCMEAARYWHSTFDFCYPDNAAFETALLDSAMGKARG